MAGAPDAVRRTGKAEFMKRNALMKRTVVHPFFGLACVVFLLFILPQVGAAATVAGCAVILSTYVLALRERFRSRSGSLMPAVWLVGAMWMLAAAVAGLSWTGKL
jgi:hypothetical protein